MPNAYINVLTFLRQHIHVLYLKIYVQQGNYRNVDRNKNRIIPEDYANKFIMHT